MNILFNKRKIIKSIYFSFINIDFISINIFFKNFKMFTNVDEIVILNININFLSKIRYKDFQKQPPLKSK